MLAEVRRKAIVGQKGESFKFTDTKNTPIFIVAESKYDIKEGKLIGVYEWLSSAIEKANEYFKETGKPANIFVAVVIAESYW